MKLSEKIKELKENIEITLYAIPLSIAMFYYLITAFTAYIVWIMLGLLVWCCIIAIKNNLKTIKYCQQKQQKFSQKGKEWN